MFKVLRAVLLLLVIQFTCALESEAQIIFNRDQALFETANGATQRVNTGRNEHLFVGISRDKRFVTFSTPDPVSNNGVPPSSDIYAFDRVTRTTRRIIDQNSSVGLPNTMNSTALSAELSPNNQLIAYGTQLTIRQGLANPQSTRELNIANASNGVIVANPTFGRGPVSDAFQSEFVGLSWDPGGNSFITPNYVQITSQAGSPIELPGIVRFTRSGQTWNRTLLVTPQYFNLQFPPAARTYIYPAVSPNGNSIAFFSMTWPDAITNSVGVIARLVVADANGNNTRLLREFPQGTFPSGLAWSANGAQLFYSVSDQTFFNGIGFLPSANQATSQIRAINVNNGAVSSIAGVTRGVWPVASTAATPGGGGNDNGGNSSDAGSIITSIINFLLQ